MTIETLEQGHGKKIAILGWGSLLWEERQDFDQWRKAWQCEGPTLRLEFSRVSKSRLRALTLVIDPENGPSTTVAYCLSKRADPNDVICDLRSREGTTLRHIGYVFLGTERNHYRDRESYDAISAWAKGKKLDVVVWTDLPSNFETEVGRAFSVQSAIDHLKSLGWEARAKAAEYMRRAPAFVQTPLRRAMENEAWFSGG